MVAVEVCVTNQTSLVSPVRNLVFYSKCGVRKKLFLPLSRARWISCVETVGYKLSKKELCNEQVKSDYFTRKLNRV